MREIYEACIKAWSVGADEGTAFVIWDMLIEGGYRPSYGIYLTDWSNLPYVRPSIIPGFTPISMADGTFKRVPNGQSIYIYDIPSGFYTDQLGQLQIPRIRYILREPEELTEWVFANLDRVRNENARRQTEISRQTILPQEGWTRWIPPKPEQTPELDVDAWLPHL